MIKKIGILTSGGDAPGMNAALVGAIKTASKLNKEIYAIYEGYRGILEKKFYKIEPNFLDDYLSKGGTHIKTARLPEFKEEKVRKEAVKILKEEDIDALIVIGGDGSYQGAKKLNDLGILTVGLPGTIDNDIASTDFTIGFDTCLNTVVTAIDNIKDTMQSHNRCGVIEIMGNRCSDLTIYAGVATNADIVITPSNNPNLDDVIAELKEMKSKDKEYAIVLVAEKYIDTAALLTRIQKETSWDARLTVLGHIQRGGTPSAIERVNAIRMGSYAVTLLNKDIGGVCVGIIDDKLTYFDIDEALKLPNKTHNDLYELFDYIKK